MVHSYNPAMSNASAVVTRQQFGTGLQLFASAQAEPRARRPTDIALAIVSAVMVVIAIGFNTVASTFEADISTLIASLPGLLEPLWRIA
jgi:hypothetical protein